MSKTYHVEVREIDSDNGNTITYSEKVKRDKAEAIIDMILPKTYFDHEVEGW